MIDFTVLKPYQQEGVCEWSSLLLHYGSILHCKFQTHSGGRFKIRPFVENYIQDNEYLLITF